MPCSQSTYLAHQCLIEACHMQNDNCKRTQKLTCMNENNVHLSQHSSFVAGKLFERMPTQRCARPECHCTVRPVGPPQFCNRSNSCIQASWLATCVCYKTVAERLRSTVGFATPLIPQLCSPYCSVLLLACKGWLFGIWLFVGHLIQTLFNYRRRCSQKLCSS